MTVEERKKTLDEELHRIVEAIVRIYRPEKIILFGSLSTGKTREWSDIDLIVIKKTEKRFLDRIKEVLLIARPVVGCDIVVYTPDEYNEMLGEKNSFATQEVARKGKVLYAA